MPKAEGLALRQSTCLTQGAAAGRNNVVSFTVSDKYVLPDCWNKLGFQTSAFCHTSHDHLLTLYIDNGPYKYVNQAAVITAGPEECNRLLTE